MSQVIPNRTDLQGMVLARRSHPTLPGFDLLAVEVRSATPVPGQADLLSRHVGTTIELAVRHTLLPRGDVKGWGIRCRAYMAGPGVFRVETDPSPDEFALDPPESPGQGNGEM
jgi:hypothetical protein